MHVKSLIIKIVTAVSLGISSAAAQLSTSDVQTPVADGDTANIPQNYYGPSSSVAAIVNDQVVTTYDVEQRMKLMIITSGGRLRPEMIGQLQSQAMRDLVQEKLKLQEAAKFELKIPDRDIDGELSAIAGQSGLSAQQLEQALGQDGISLETLREQIRVNIAWPELVQGRFGSRVRISDDEVENNYQRMREDATKEQFLVSEICIPIEDQRQARAYYEGALQLIEQMRRGVPFAVVAQQFSACTSAAAGGDLGWVRAGELEPELDEAVRALPPGAVTNPIPSDGALMIMALRDKRAAAVKGEESFTLAYAGAPVSMGRSAARQALEKLATPSICQTGGRRPDLGPGVGVALFEGATLNDIDERFRSSIEDLGRHEMSPIIEADDVLHAAFVCSKDEGLGLPPRAALKDRLYGRQLTRISQQYVRDLERDSLVEVRLKEPRLPQQPR